MLFTKNAKDAPVSRAVQAVGRIFQTPILGGLHRHYVRIDFRQGQETQTETRAAHRQKRCVRLPATQPGPRPVRPRPSGHSAPQSLAGLGFPGERQIPCSGVRIPCSGSNSALKFPARLRREFCKKTTQYQWFSHTPFARSGSNSQKFPAFSLLAGNFAPRRVRSRLAHPPVLPAPTFSAGLRAAEIPSKHGPSRAILPELNAPAEA